MRRNFIKSSGNIQPLGLTYSTRSENRIEDRARHKARDLVRAFGHAEALRLAQRGVIEGFEAKSRQFWKDVITELSLVR